MAGETCRACPWAAAGQFWDAGLAGGPGEAGMGLALRPHHLHRTSLVLSFAILNLSSRLRVGLMLWGNVPK